MSAARRRSVVVFGRVDRCASDNGDTPALRSDHAVLGHVGHTSGQWPGTLKSPLAWLATLAGHSGQNSGLAGRAGRAVARA
jgi:hypothetical protein